jgi:hypothetical protein
MIICISSVLIFSVICKAQSIFKCSPIDGSLDTFAFNSGSDSGVACVHGSGTASMVMYIERLSPDGERKMAVAATKFNKKTKRHEGTLYRLFPPGPKKEFTARSKPGYISLNFGDGLKIDLGLKPNGLAWIPADIRQLSGCAMETPQLMMSVLDQRTSQTSKMMLCAMTHKAGSGYGALYGFGLRPSPNVGMDPFFFLGTTINPITPTGPINVVANAMDVCTKSDCKLCTMGFKSLTLSN